MTQLQTETLAPVVKTVRIAFSQRRAFERFTAQMGVWWPLNKFSIGEDRAQDVVFGSSVGDAIVEHLDDGSTAIWGSITEWDPPRRVRFTWHPGREASTSQLVLVTFTEIEDGTEVQITHSGWERLGEEGPKMRDDYNNGWDVVLDLFSNPRSG